MYLILNKKRAVFNFSIFFIFLTCFLLYCSNDSSPAKTDDVDGYAVTYDANGADEGTVPNDGNTYEEDEMVTVLGNTGNLKKSGYEFSGWNRSINGSGSTYTANDTFPMNYENVILYAEWRTTHTVYDLRFQDGEIQAWTEDEERGYTEYTSTNMVELMGPYAMEFVNKGMVEGFEQRMHNGEKTFRTWVVDFGSEANAASAYTYFAASEGSPESAGSYSLQKAFLTPGSAGYTGFATFGTKLIYIVLDGYGANMSEAKSNIVAFIEVYQDKINRFF